MAAETFSLRHFLIGKFTRSPLDDYNIYALHPAHDLSVFAAVCAAIDPILKTVASGRTSVEVRLVVPSNLGAIYIRQFASMPPDAAGRPIARAHVVLLDTDQLEALAWRPWALDAWLAGGIGRDRVVGPNGMEDKVDPDRPQVELPIEVQLSALSDPTPLAAEARSQVALGVQCLEKRLSVCIREERTALEDALAQVAALLAATRGSVGVAIGVTPTIPWCEDLIRDAALRIVFLGSGSGRAPDHWLELARLPQQPDSVYAGALPRSLDISAADPAKPSPIAIAPSPAPSEPPPLVGEPGRIAPVTRTAGSRRIPTRENAEHDAVSYADAPRYGIWVLGFMLAVSVVGNIYQKSGLTAGGNRGELAQWRQVGQLVRGGDSQESVSPEEATHAWHGLEQKVKAADASAAKAKAEAKAEVDAADKRTNEVEKRLAEANKLAETRKSTLSAWEFAASYLTRDLSRQQLDELIATIERTPPDRAAIRELLSEYRLRHKPRAGNAPARQ